MDRIEKILVFVVVATIVVIVTLALSNTGDDPTNDEGGDLTTSIADDSRRVVSDDGVGEATGLDVDLSPPTVIPSDHGSPPNPAIARGLGAPGSGPVDNDVGGDDAVHAENLPGPTPAPAPRPAPARQTYVVKPNDSLWKISKQFYGDGKYWRRLQEANTDKVGPDGGVKPNTTLVAPPIKRAAAATEKIHIVLPNGEEAAADTSGRYRIVTLRKGEWLYQVLRRENMTARKKDVLKLNGLTEVQARDLKPGFRLKLPLR